MASNKLALSSPILLWNQITPTPLNDNLVTVVVALERQKCVAAAAEAMTINRERLRLRNDELETANLEQAGTIKTLSAQVQDLQQDNVKLFEKIRFLQSCGSSPR